MSGLRIRSADAFIRTRSAAAFAVLSIGIVAAPLAAPNANAQHAPIKWIDASGRVHYSDRPPLPDATGRQVVTPTPVATAPRTPSIGDPALPWALRSAAARYPVTLYTTLECEPCGLARTHLGQRGVPYTEKRVETAGDLRAFQELGFPSALFPSVSIGPEKITGYESIGWDRALDATGYPKSSMLPAHREARRVEPMRAEAATRAAPPASGEANAVADERASNEANADETGGLLSPASFKTGPNPIRF